MIVPNTSTKLHPFNSTSSTELAFLLGQDSILGRMGGTEPISSVLDALVELIEHLFPNAIASILELDPTEKTLQLVAARHLPKSLHDACQRLEIGPTVGTCGRAAFLKAPVYTIDMRSDPHWSVERTFFDGMELRSCWSIPILSSSHLTLGRSILGTIALYTDTPGLPCPETVRILERAAVLARMALEFRLAQERFVELDSQFQNAFLHSSQSMVVHDENGMIVDANPSSCSSLGHTRNELLGRSIFSFHEQDQNGRAAGMRERIRLGECYRYFTSLRTSNGTSMPASITTSLHRKTPSLLMISAWSDLPQLDRVEQELVWRNEGLKLLNDAANSILSEDQSQGTIEELFTRIAKHVGCTGYANYGFRNDLLELETWSGLPETFVESIRQIRVGERLCGQCAALGTTLHLDLTKIQADPDLAPLIDIGIRSYCGVPLFWEERLLGTVAFFSTIRDRFGGSDIDLIEAVGKFVTVAMMRSLEQETLRASETRFRELADVMPQLVWMCNAQGNVHYGNLLATQVMGNAGCIDWLGAIHPDDQGLVVQRWTAAIMSGSMYEAEHRIFDRSQGCYRWYFARAIPILDESDQVQCWVGAATDIDNVKQSEDALRTSEAELRAFFNASNVGMWEGDLQGKLRRVNDAFCAMLGYTREELLGRFVLEYIDPSEHDSANQVMARLISSEIPEYQAEHMFRTKCGVPLYVRSFLKIVSEGPARQGSIAGVLVDLTTTRKLEEQVHQAQKMEALGRLAGGVAHDFNNVLTVILGTSELVMMQKDLNQEIKDSVAMIHNAASRAAGLTRQLLTFGRKQLAAPKWVDCNEIICRIDPILRGALGKAICLEHQLEHDLPFIRIDPVQFEQVLINLVFNARDASRKGSRVMITTRVLDRSDEGDLSTEPFPRVQIGVTDCGSGISDQVLPSIFEPFFTTKEVGKGTGLGLAVVHGIIEQNRGRIRVDTELERGSSFWLDFPAFDRNLAADSKDPPLDGPIEGDGIILIVDDEPAICDVAARNLQSQKYLTRIAHGSLEALEILRELGDRIALMLTDIQMPKMNGEQLATAARLICPNLRIVFMTGFTPQEVPFTDPELETKVVIMKPFHHDDLIQVIRDAFPRSTTVEMEP